MKYCSWCARRFITDGQRVTYLGYGRGDIKTDGICLNCKSEFLKTLSPVPAQEDHVVPGSQPAISEIGRAQKSASGGNTL